MTDKPVVIKGTRGGLKIQISQGTSLDDAINAINDTLSKGKPFFNGSMVNITFISDITNEEDRESLISTIAGYMQVGTVVFEVHKDEKKLEQSSDEITSDRNALDEKNSDEISGYFSGIEEGMTRFVRGTIRNGQRIFYEGNIVVIGDVNPGGEIVAGGNIIILGTIRGIAHAGYSGNPKSVVAAYSLQPTQLRIASMITRAPEGEALKPEYPEIAHIRDGSLIIEPYLQGRSR